MRARAVHNERRVDGRGDLQLEQRPIRVLLVDDHRDRLPLQRKRGAPLALECQSDEPVTADADEKRFDQCSANRVLSSMRLSISFGDGSEPG